MEFFTFIGVMGISFIIIVIVSFLATLPQEEPDEFLFKWILVCFFFAFFIAANVVRGTMVW